VVLKRIASANVVGIFLSVGVELGRSHCFNCDDHAETNPTEVTTIECGDEPGRLKAFLGLEERDIKVRKGRGRVQNQGYIKVGDCYVHRIMQGQNCKRT
jgi:hypothetical protein